MLAMIVLHVTVAVSLSTHHISAEIFTGCVTPAGKVVRNAAGITVWYADHWVAVVKCEGVARMLLT